MFHNIIILLSNLESPIKLSQYGAFIHSRDYFFTIPHQVQIIPYLARMLNPCSRNIRLFHCPTHHKSPVPMHNRTIHFRQHQTQILTKLRRPAAASNNRYLKQKILPFNINRYYRSTTVCVIHTICVNPRSSVANF